MVSLLGSRSSDTSITPAVDESGSGKVTARIGIIGVGPRGLTVLERIVAHERQRRSGDIEMILFDPNPPGTGCHDPEQSDIHLVNTVAGQLTQFSDPSVVGAGPVMKGPTFFQWLQEQSALGALRTVDADRISPDDYYPRGLFGRYLIWVFRYVCALAPAHVRIVCKRTTVTRAHRTEDGSWVLETADAKVPVDYLFLTTGHTKPARPARVAQTLRVTGLETVVIDDPFPMQVKLSGITATMTVAVEGMGLTAFDVISDLTVGRGGRFTKCMVTGNLNYHRSGHEPRILLFSRSGIPLGARAVNQKGVSNQYRPRFLFADKLRELRARRRLDFGTDVMPLLIADMEHAYYEAYLRERKDAASALLFSHQFPHADAAQRRALIARYIPEPDRFSWDSLASPIPVDALSDRATFRHWLAAHLHRDVQEARKGNLDSSVKAACDVLRDLRDNLRAAIEFGGLTEESHRWVLSEFLPIMNRLAVGPPQSRITEMIALMQADVLQADFGPGARCTVPSHGGLMRVSAQRWPSHWTEVHALVRARISMHSPKADASSLLRGLLDDGHVRLFHNGSFHPGGIEIDPNHNWVDATGSIVENAWALGIPTEGIKFCTFVIPRTGVNSTAMADAGRAVCCLLSAIARRNEGHAFTAADVLPTEEDASAFASLHGSL
ncbi:MAG TPA: FAD/NAD(P)-binding protein [Albitalea sp.]|uniref:FAD/NAD(P)-binding protein n=1 Tax=Piscinibacter sp. TaxID=1903157 RepID=UPI002ED334B0